MTLHVLDLFSGIGGFSLGLERAGGFHTAAFCEYAPYPRAVLRKHWPTTPIFPDVRGVGAAGLAAAGVPRVDVVCGGFPCQDISLAGKGAGLAGERSGLWFEMLRIIDETRPAWIIAENVAALRSRGLDTVLGGLASIGYDAEWHCIPASAIGAPHRRDRVWIVGYPTGGGWRKYRDECGALGGGPGAGQPAIPGATLADPDEDGGGRQRNGFLDAEGTPRDRTYAVGFESFDARGNPPLAYTRGAGLSGAERPGGPEPLVTATDIRRSASERHWRYVEPGVGGTDDGLPAWLHRYPVAVAPWEAGTPRTVGKGYLDRRARLMALGNSIVPQMAEMIGRAILAFEVTRPG